MLLVHVERWKNNMPPGTFLAVKTIFLPLDKIIPRILTDLIFLQVSFLITSSSSGELYMLMEPEND